MARHEYEVRDVLRLLNVKAHILRYWEQSLPIIRSRRDQSGRRIWSAAQLRMLLRIRHLVVVRGMSVAAAGEAVLHEAVSGTADTKARLEELRARLLALLLRTRAGASGMAAPGSVSESIPAPEAAEELLKLDTLVPDASERPMRGSRPGRDDTAGIRLVDLRSCEPGGSAAPAAGPSATLPVCVSHLWSEGPADGLARMVRKLLEESALEGPWVVPVPPQAESAFRQVFAGDEAASTERWFLLPLRRTAHGAAVWWSPRLALYAALAADRRLDAWLGARGVARLLLTAPEAPLPVGLSDAAWHAALDGERAGAVPALVRRGSGFVLSETTLLDLERLRPRLSWLCSSGRRSWMAPGPDGQLHWRYDLWQRDLIKRVATCAVLPVFRRPLPWPGRTWFSELAAIRRGEFTA